MIDALATCGGFTPESKARIFDTSHPGSARDGDPDMGSPNTRCEIPGPGRGVAGRPGKPGENCKPQGNVLIIQESDKPTPDNNQKGGVVCFRPVDGMTLDVAFLGLMGISPDSNTFIE